MADLKKSYTQIVETARLQLSISRDEYALCSYLQYRAADPRQKAAGWCCDEKSEMAEFIGVTRAGLYKMANRLDVLGLIETGISGWRVTAKWIDTETQCKQSLQDGVNKVDAKCKQSLRGGVNKVDTHTKVEYDISRNELEEEEKNASLSSSTSEPENISLKAEKKENDLHRGAAADYDFCACEHCGGAGFRYGRNGKEVCPECDGSRTVVKPKKTLEPPFTPTGETIEPQPATIVRLYEKGLPGVTVIDSVPGTYETKQDPRTTPPAEFKRVNIQEEVKAMRTDQTALEGFVIGRKLPREKFAEYLSDFEAEQIGLKTNYKNERELRLHFLNWSGVHHEVAQRKTNVRPSKPNRSQITHAGGDLSKYGEPQKF